MSKISGTDCIQVAFSTRFRYRHGLFLELSVFCLGMNTLRKE